MAKFSFFGVPVTVFEVVPHPDDLADEYKRIYDNNDDKSIDRVLDIEVTMHAEYNLVQSKGQWVEFEDDEEEEQPSGWFSRWFG